MNLTGKTAIVTGGNSGIGLAIVIELAKQGANIVIDYVVHPETAVTLEKQLLALGEKAIAVQADVSKTADLQKLVDAAVQNFGRLDIIVNNAGAFPHAAIGAQEAAGLSQTLRLNLEAPFQIVNAFIGDMRARKSGDIVTVGSVADKTAFTGNAEYSASKYGIQISVSTEPGETRMARMPAAICSGVGATAGFISATNSRTESCLPEGLPSLKSCAVWRSTMVAALRRRISVVGSSIE